MRRDCALGCEARVGDELRVAGAAQGTGAVINGFIVPEGVGCRGVVFRGAVVVVMMVLLMRRGVRRQRIEDQCAANIPRAEMKRCATGNGCGHVTRRYNPHRQRIGEDREQGENPARCACLTVKGCHGSVKAQG